MTRLFTFLLLTTLLSACVGEDILEDFVQPQLQIESFPDTLEAGTTFQLTTRFLNNVGLPEDVSPTWSSADETILSVTPTGLASGITEGTTTVTATFVDTEFNETTTLTEAITVGASTVVVDGPSVKRGTVATTTFYELKGEFTLAEVEGQDGLTLTFGDDYVADDGLPGLYIYLSNNPTSRAGAFEIGAVTTFTGAHTYENLMVGIDEYTYVLYYCKPFNVKVGDGLIEE